jgi:CHAT domain-containing protein/TPR repeat protein
MLRRLPERLLLVLRVAAILLAALCPGLSLAQDAAAPLTEADIPPLLAQASGGNVEAMTWLGDAYRLGQGVAADPAEALRWYEMAAAKGDAYGNFYVAFLLKDRNQPGDLDRALKIFTRAIPQYRKIFGANHPQLAIAYNQLGVVQERRFDFAAALDAYRKALAIRRKFGDRHPETAGMLNNVANMLQTLGKLDEARQAYVEVLDVYEQAFGHEHEAVATTLMNFGALERKATNFGRAFDLYQQALAIFTRLKSDPAAIADIHYNIGFIKMQLGLIDEALTADDEALRLYGLAYGSDHPTVATVENVRAGMLERLGRIEEAEAAARHALAIFTRSFGEEHPQVATARSNLAVILATAGKNEEALAENEKALAHFLSLHGEGSGDAARVLNNIASLEMDRGRMDAALAHAVRSIAIRSAKSGLDASPSSYGLLATMMARQQNLVAARLFSKLMINTAQGMREGVGGDSPLSAKVDRALAGQFGFLTDQLTAEGAFSEAQFVASLLKGRELASFAGDGAAAPALARVKLAPSEDKLAQSFAKLFAPAHKLLGRIETEAKKKQSAARDRKLQTLRGDLDEAYAKLADDVSNLFKTTEEARLAGQAERLALNERYAEDLQKELARFGGDTALYQAIATDRALHLFVTAPGRDTIHRQVTIDRADLAHEVYAAVGAVESRADDADAKLARLYDLLIRPIAADLEAAKPRVLMLNLSGFLRYVPYAALKSGDKYLIEDYALTLATPAAVTLFTASDDAAPTAAGFGVSAAHEGFAPLPGVALELEAIFSGADGAGALPGTPRLDAAFDAASFKAALREKPRYLHIASHFRFVPGNENNSFLLLGTGEHLGLGDLRSNPELRFSGVDLLTLSACETARGGGSEGEEIESFGALAQMSGASAVMATLWQIADDSTAALMADFYRGRIEEGLDKATALQRAQIAMLKGSSTTELAARGVTLVETDSSAPAAPSTAHPYYWSAFILMGNWR